LSKTIDLLKEKLNQCLDLIVLKLLRTICGIETMHMIKKGQVEEIQCALSEVDFFNNLMGMVA